MTKMVVVLEWDEKNLGRSWMNEGNLNLCLFSPEHSKPELLKVAVIATEEEETAIKKRVAEEQSL